MVKLASVPANMAVCGVGWSLGVACGSAVALVLLAVMALSGESSGELSNWRPAFVGLLLAGLWLRFLIQLAGESKVPGRGRFVDTATQGALFWGGMLIGAVLFVVSALSWHMGTGIEWQRLWCAMMLTFILSVVSVVLTSAIAAGEE
jgi:hypothetical protein